MKKILAGMVIGMLLLIALCLPISTAKKTTQVTYYVPYYEAGTSDAPSSEDTQDLLLIPSGVAGEPAYETSWDSSIYTDDFPDYLTAVQAFDEDFIQNNQNEKIGFLLPDHTTEAGTITSVTVIGYLEIIGLSVLCKLYLWNQTNDEGNESDTLAPTSEGAYFEIVFSEYRDADEARAWTWADIDALEVQLAKTEGNPRHNIICNHLYVQVSYIPEKSDPLPTLVPVQDALRNIKTSLPSNDLPKHMKKSVSEKLDDAIKFFEKNKFDRAIDKLSDIIKQLNHKNRKSPYDAADKLIDDLQYIIDNVQ